MTRPPNALDGREIDTYLALMEVSSQIRFRLEAHLREESELSHIQFEILGNLMRTPGQQLRMTDLADGIAISRSGLTYQVRVLADRGLVSRETSADDERIVLVALTAAGRAEFLRLLPGHIEIVRSILFDALPAKDASSLGLTLGRLRDRLRELPPRSTQQRS